MCADRGDFWLNTRSRSLSLSISVSVSLSLSFSFIPASSLSLTQYQSLSLTRGDMRCIQPCAPDGFTGADWNYYYNNAKFFCPPRGNQPFTFFFSVRKWFLCIRIIFHRGINMDFTFDLTPFFIWIDISPGSRASIPAYKFAIRDYRIHIIII